jgi:hypothetical protein
MSVEGDIDRHLGTDNSPRLQLNQGKIAVNGGFCMCRESVNDIIAAKFDSLLVRFRISDFVSRFDFVLAWSM